MSVQDKSKGPGTKWICMRLGQFYSVSYFEKINIHLMFRTYKYGIHVIKRNFLILRPVRQSINALTHMNRHKTSRRDCQ